MAAWRRVQSWLPLAPTVLATRARRVANPLAVTSWRRMATRSPPVELHRTFLDVPQGEASFDPAASARMAAAFGSEVRWDDLLAERCVVVLGEAGTGKTTEFREKARQLSEEARAAFFVSIEDLALKGLERSLGLADEAAFQRWRSTDARLHLFLDSLDEARLRGHRFVAALRQLERDLGRDLGRTSVILSSRVSDWRAQEDLAAIASLVQGTSKSDDPPVRVVALAPLNEPQIVTLVRTFGVTDPEFFTQAVRRASAQIFVERPRDVEWLAVYWREHGRIGSLRDIVEHNVDQKLRERNPDRTTRLSLADARKGAAALAGVATLARVASFVLPDGSLDPDRALGTLDPQAVLADWTNEEIADLLTRALFDEATYGRVRIHHRTVQEYLTAKWLLALLEGGYPRAKLEALIFRKSANGTRVTPELASAAAWLALWDDRVRDRLVGVAPHTLIAEGDPSGLPVRVRSRLLRAHAGQFQGRARLFQSFDRVGLGRFAAEELAETLNELLASRAEPEELRQTLLRIVAEGPVRGSAEAAFAVATDASASVELRATAVRAVGATGSAAQKEGVVANVLSSDEVDEDLAGAVVSTFYPEWLDVAGLLTLLRIIRRQEDASFTSLDYTLGHQVPSGTKETDRAVLAQGLLNLVGGTDPDADPPDRPWLLESLARLTTIMIDADLSSTPEVEASLRLFERCNGTSYVVRRALDLVESTIDSKSKLKRQLFWKIVNQARVRLKRRAVRHFDILEGFKLWNLAATDATWLANDAENLPDFYDRMVAMDALFSTPCRDGEGDDRRTLLRRVAASDERLSRRLERVERRTPRPHERQEHFARLERAQDLRDRRRRDQAQKWFAANLDAVRSGTDLTILWNLYHHCTRNDALLVESIQPIVDDYGPDVAEAAREGWKRFWRNCSPLLPHEERSRRSDLVVVGLNGIASDIDDGLDLSRLTTPDALTASRYALCALNAFPPWLDRLAAAQRTAVENVMRTALLGEYSIPAGHPAAYGVLAKLPWASATVRSVAAPTLLDLLKAADPDRDDVLRQVVDTILSTSETETATFSRIATERFGAATDSERALIWWGAWFNVDPGASVAALDERLAAEPSTATEQMIASCDHLHEWIDHHTACDLIIPKNAEVLKRLIVLAYTHISPHDDIRHVGAYSPGPRDHAQTMRSRFVEWLARIDADASVRALRELADDPRLASHRDWFLHLAETRHEESSGLRSSGEASELLDLYKRHGVAALDHIESLIPDHMKTDPVDFVVITALQEELQSVLSHLPEANKLEKDGSDTHTYYWCELPTSRSDGAVYRVVVTALAGMGPEMAVAKARDVVTRWKPRNVLLVGIACGVPGKAVHGDLLIADQVVDDSLGKRSEAGREVRWKAFPAGANLLDSAANMGTDWHAAIAKPRPGSGVPGAHIGTVASGGDVIADKETITQYREQWPKLVGIEMEAAGSAIGVHNSVTPPEFLMIKSVSDLGTDKKKASLAAWRPYACEVAAAFAVQFMRSGPVPAVR